MTSSVCFLCRRLSFGGEVVAHADYEVLDMWDKYWILGVAE